MSELDALDVPVWVTAVVVVGVETAVPDGVKVAGLDGVKVPDGVEETAPVCEQEVLEVPVTEALRVAEGLAVEDREELRLGAPDALALTVSDCVDEVVPDELPVNESVPVAELEEELVLVTELDELPVTVPVLELDEELLGVLVPLTLGVPDWLMVSAALELSVASVVAKLEGDAVWLEEEVPVALVEPEGLILEVEAGVSAGEALRRVAMLRPRKVMAEMVASASPASHSVDSRMPLEKALLGMSWVMFT